MPMPGGCWFVSIPGWDVIQTARGRRRKSRNWKRNRFTIFSCCGNRILALKLFLEQCTSFLWRRRNQLARKQKGVRHVQVHLSRLIGDLPTQLRPKNLPRWYFAPV